MLEFSIASCERVTAVRVTDVITAGTKTFEGHDRTFADVNWISRCRNTFQHIQTHYSVKGLPYALVEHPVPDFVPFAIIIAGADVG